MRTEMLSLEKEKERDEILEAAGYWKCFDSHRGMYDGGRYYHWHRPEGGTRTADGQTWAYNNTAVWAIAEEEEMDMVVANAIGACEG